MGALWKLSSTDEITKLEQQMSPCMYCHYSTELCAILADYVRYEWMDERCFRPLLCTVKAELGRGQPGLMR